MFSLVKSKRLLMEGANKFVYAMCLHFAGGIIFLLYYNVVYIGIYNSHIYFYLSSTLQCCSADIAYVSLDLGVQSYVLIFSSNI